MRSKRLKAYLFFAVMLCMTVFSVTVFADGGYYTSDENGDNSAPPPIGTISVSTEGVSMPENAGEEALTPDGNLTLIDDILQDNSYYVSEEYIVANKQFITVQSKNGNYFYLVIDRSGDTENVYFLNLVDEADLLALMEEADTVKPACICTDKCEVGDINTSCEVCRTNMSGCAGKVKEVPKETEPEPEPDKDDEDDKPASNTGLIAVVLLAAAGGSGALYWFKLRKPKADAKGTADLDNYGYDDDDEEYETEEDDDSDTEDSETND